MNIPLYFDLLHHFQTDNDPKVNPFSEYFGKIFEVYVGKQLKLLEDGGQIIEEFQYDNDGSKKFCDYSLIYGDETILIEVKKNLIPIRTKYELDTEKIKGSIENGIIKAFEQLYKKIGHIRESIAGLEKFSKIKKFYPVVVVFDDSYSLNGSFFKSIIDEKLLEKNISFDIPWQIITIRELEILVSSLNQRKSLRDILEDKTGETIKLNYDFDIYLQNQEIEKVENSYIVKAIKDNLDKWNKTNNSQITNV